MIERQTFEPVITGLAMLKLAHDMYPAEFRWKEPPYEYVYDRNPFDVIAGTSSIREAIERGSPTETIQERWKGDLDAFMELRKDYLLY